MQSSRLLTKSKYMNGLQCLKYLWFIFVKPDAIPETDATAQYRFDEGKAVTELAQKLYPQGVRIPIDNFTENIEQTKRLIKERKLLFEAGILADNIYSRIDILKPADGSAWDIIEVKSAVSIKSEYIPDIAFQRFCCQKAGLVIRKCFIAYINNEYVRQGDLEPQKMFKLEDVTEIVDQSALDIQQKIDEMFGTANSKEYPDIAIGKHCNDPHECPLTGHCWAFLPENNVFDLSRGGKKSVELFQRGILAIKDIPDGFKLTDKQHIQKSCAVTDSVYSSKEDLKSFLESLHYPLYYFDFESFASVIPPYNGTRPYQQIPFQFSVHKVTEDRQVEHRSFLADGVDDPRVKLTPLLKQALGGKGSIIVFYQSFEKSRLKELAEAFPEHKAWIDDVLERIVDLHIPFRDFHYYNSVQKGSASIKEVLPAITGQGYDGMAISDGLEASISYLDIIFGDVPSEEKKKIRSDLEKYCSLDTEGMIWIVKKLEDLVHA